MDIYLSGGVDLRQLTRLVETVVLRLLPESLLELIQVLLLRDLVFELGYVLMRFLEVVVDAQLLLHFVDRLLVCRCV